MRVNDKESRAKHHMQLLLRAFEVHNELEEERKQAENDDFVPQALEIKIFIPEQELLDTSKSLQVAGIDQDTMTIFVLQLSGNHNDFIPILLGDITFITYCNLELQERMIKKLKSLYTYQPTLRIV